LFRKRSVVVFSQSLRFFDGDGVGLNPKTDPCQNSADPATMRLGIKSGGPSDMTQIPGEPGVPE
jgi:hypothetical protein